MGSSHRAPLDSAIDGARCRRTKEAPSSGRTRFNLFKRDNYVTRALFGTFGQKSLRPQPGARIEQRHLSAIASYRLVTVAIDSICRRRGAARNPVAESKTRGSVSETRPPARPRSIPARPVAMAAGRAGPVRESIASVSATPPARPPQDFSRRITRARFLLSLFIRVSICAPLSH